MREIRFRVTEDEYKRAMLFRESKNMSWKELYFYLMDFEDFSKLTKSNNVLQDNLFKFLEATQSDIKSGIDELNSKFKKILGEEDE